MKRILVLSDSHGNMENMVYAVELVKPDMIIHLGDCISDAERLSEHFKDILFECVPGNCDCTMAPAEKILDIEGARILICHGHTYNVKRGLLNIELSAREKEVDLALFGHTHKVFYDWTNGVRLFNPGSIGSPGYQIPPSYGILTIDKDTGTFDMETAYIE